MLNQTVAMEVPLLHLAEVVEEELVEKTGPE
jgi:hypothetical protein